MAHKRDYKPEDILFPDQVITTSDIVPERMNKKSILAAMLKSEQKNLNDTLSAPAVPTVRERCFFPYA